ncbi:MAG TPA: hypothetical protein VH596_09615 [Terriglobales bacterium]|jgi:hypothetical protein
MKKYLAASAEFCDQIQTRKYSTTKIRPDEGKAAEASEQNV